MHIISRLLFFITMSLLMQTAGAVVEADVSGVQQNARPAPPAYPKWSGRAVNRDAVPAPPSGPYMSTGLSNAGRGFAGRENRSPAQMYSPMPRNMPWPERRRPPQQWMPDSGRYSYAPGNAANYPIPMQPGRYGMQEPQPMWLPMYPRPPQGRYR